MDTEQLTEAMQHLDPITKALRESLENVEMVTTLRAKILGQCANIDAIHRSLERHDTLLLDRINGLCAQVEKREDVTLFGVDYMALPVDKDDVPVHVDDVLEWIDGNSFTVCGIGRNGTIFYVDDDETEHAEWTTAEFKRHHAQTVDEVLRRFAEEIIANCARVEDHECTDAIEKYSKRLQLAEASNER